MRAVFIFNLSQWEVWRRCASPDDCVLTTDVDTFAALRSEGARAFDLSGFLTAREFEAERQSALNLCDMLGEALREAMPDDLHALSRHLSHELLYPIGHFFQIRAMTDRALKELRPMKAIIFSEEQQVFFWDPPNVPPDLANSAARDAAATLGVSVERLACPPTHVAPSNQSADQQHLWIAAFESPLEPASTVAVGQGMWWAEMDALVTSANAHRLPISAISTAWMHYVLPRSELPHPKIMAWVDRAVRLVADRTPALRPALECAGLRSLFSAWTGLVETGIHYYRFGRIVCDALTPRVVIHGYDIRAPQRCFAQAVWESGAAPLSILHGGINGMDHEGIRHREAVGHLAVWSERDARTLAPARNPAFGIRAIGSLRSDIDRLNIVTREAPQVSRDRGARKPRVVFLTCRISGLYWFTTDIGRHVETWAEIRSLFARHPEWDGLIKTHPRYDHQRLYGDDALPDNLRVARVSLDSALEEADAVVMVNLETTAALDAIGRGIPVIHLNTATRGEPDRWVRDSGVRALRSIAELEAELVRACSDREYAVACAQAPRSKLNEFIAATGAGAVSRLERWIAELCANRQARDPDPSALFRLKFAQWLDRLYLSDPNAPPPAGAGGAHAREPLLASHLLHRLTWYPWPPSPFSRARALWRAYLHMPREWNPSFRTFRRYVIECLHQDAKNSLRSSVARAWSRVVARLLAPFGRR